MGHDGRGFGEVCTVSSMPHSHVDDPWQVMDSLGYDSAVLVGCSMGGRIAIDAALARPGSVSGWVVVAPGVSGAPAPPHGDPVKALMDADPKSLLHGNSWKRSTDLRRCRWGDLDLRHLQERCKRDAQRIPQARSFVVPGVAHLPPLEAPLEFNAVCGQYLARWSFALDPEGLRCMHALQVPKPGA